MTWQSVDPKSISRSSTIGRKAASTHADLLEVEEVLQSRDLAKENAVRDGVRGEEGRGEMICVSGLASVRSEPEGVYERD